MEGRVKKENPPSLELSPSLTLKDVRENPGGRLKAARPIPPWVGGVEAGGVIPTFASEMSWASSREPGVDDRVIEFSNIDKASPIPPFIMP